jgi:hypothetical protein
MKKDLRVPSITWITSTQNLTQLTDSLNQMPLVSTVKNFEATSAQLKKIIDGLESGEGSAGTIAKR